MCILGHLNLDFPKKKRKNLGHPQDLNQGIECNWPLHHVEQHLNASFIIMPEGNCSTKLLGSTVWIVQNNTVIPLLRGHLKEHQKQSLKRGGLTLEVYSID